MIELPVKFRLPAPWSGNKIFETSKIGYINFLVGPNGSGKSRFGALLRKHLPKPRLLSTDRLSGMDGEGGIRSIIGDHFREGYAKNMFDRIRNAGLGDGSGIDTLILLEERLDLRIQVEATLSHLFNRRIRLVWSSGHLVATASLGPAGETYRLDREECHGIKELLVLLTHLYNDEMQTLIIDEPELNLHPQYQAFFMQEVRRVAGDPKKDPAKKIVILITHSPFILDFKNESDLRSVISFSLAHDVPRHISDISDAEAARLASIIPRLNVHHKQLFFSDNPIFVEGIIDAQFLAAIQDARGLSVAGAGSCIIDAGGCEEVNRYLSVCAAFGKSAHFLYDLDSLFTGNLRACLRADESVQSFLATMGVGGDFGKYCGELDSRLTNLIDTFLSNPNTPPALGALRSLLESYGPRKNWTSDRYPRARAAMLTAISIARVDVIQATDQPAVTDIEGRLRQICSALKEKNVLLLSGGPLERYLPSYTGNPYCIPDDAKNSSLSAEMIILSKGLTEAELLARYGELLNLIALLPSKTSVDVDHVLREYVSDYIHDLQGAVLSNPHWELTELSAFMEKEQASTRKVIRLATYTREGNGRFEAILLIAPLLGCVQRSVRVTQDTNAGMRKFEINRAAG
jgi:hypothetical protein